MNGIYRTYRKINMRPCKLWSVDLSGKISLKIGLAIPFST